MEHVEQGHPVFSRKIIVGLIVTVLVLIVTTLFVISLNKQEPVSQQIPPGEDKVTSLASQATLDNYVTRANEIDKTTPSYINAMGIAAIYAAENTQCAQAKEILDESELSVTTESKPLFESFNTEVSQICN